MTIAIAAGILVLAVATALAVPTALQWRRHRGFTANTSAHQVLSDSHASWIVDHALKVLVVACQREQRHVPGVVMVVLHENSIAVHVASPTAHPPAPWRTSASGLVWTAELLALQAAPLTPATTNPFTGIVTLGVGQAGRVFIDLNQAHGLVSIEGDPVSRRRIAAHWIAEAAIRPWGTTDADLVGLDANAAPHPAEIAAVQNLASTVASGAVGLTFVAHLPNDATSAQLVHALESPDCRWPVVVVSAVRDARWRFTAHTNGWVTSDFLPAARWDRVSARPPTVATPARPGLPS